METMKIVLRLQSEIVADDDRSTRETGKQGI